MAVADEHQNNSSVVPPGPTFSMRGGAWVGWWWSVSSPYARLSGDRNALRLSCFRRDYVFDKSNILSLRKMFWSGLRIEHAVPTYPKTIVFWVPLFRSGKRFAMLKDTLERLGYLERG